MNRRIQFDCLFRGSALKSDINIYLYEGQLRLVAGLLIGGGDYRLKAHRC